VDPVTETIAAVATPFGRGGIGIVRISGPHVRTLAEGVLGGVPSPRYATHCRFLDVDGCTIDEGIALFFPAPHSFTGEDVLELHGHGGPVVIDLVLKRVVQLGARLARPGEYSERAFLNGKLDLAQAEAIADLIDSSTAQAARSAVRSLQGELSTRVKALVEALIHLRMYVESAIDFPEEEIDFLADARVSTQLQDIRQALADLQLMAQQGCLLREGMTMVIAGLPNAGKSSLMNRLAARESAIVTETPGTTRDILREYISIDGMPLHIIDTAGLREAYDDAEREGVRRAWEAIHRADRVLLVVDDCMGVTRTEQDILKRLECHPPLTVIRNKIDLTGQAPGVSDMELGPCIALSAKTGEGMDLLKTHLKSVMGYQSTAEGTFIARRRHLEALRRAGEFLEEGNIQLREWGAGELLAEDLRQAQQALSEITGEFTTEDLLEQIFATFCIGK
jgi:tRNA modification GTPase